MLGVGDITLAGEVIVERAEAEIGLLGDIGRSIPQQVAFAAVGLIETAGRQQPCPFRPSSFLQNCRSAKTRFFEFGRHEAVTGDFTLPATSSQSRFVSIPIICQNVLAVSILDVRRYVLSLHM